MVNEGHLGKEANFDDLPDESEDQMLAPFDQVLTANVDDAATDCLGRINHNIVVFGHLKRVHWRLVQYTLVNGVRNSSIDQLAKY